MNDLPTINKKQTLVRNRINELSAEIIKAIDGVCEQNNFEITYVEINAALLQVLKSNNNYEIKELIAEE